MTSLQELRQDRNLVNSIDWDMTHEKAVSMYLEWGNNWNHGIKMVKSKDDVALYFVVYSWEDGPVLHLVRRDSNGADELAIIEMPPEVRDSFRQEWGDHKGVYSLNKDIEKWLRQELGLTETIH